MEINAVDEISSVKQWRILDWKDNGLCILLSNRLDLHNGDVNSIAGEKNQPTWAHINIACSLLLS